MSKLTKLLLIFFIMLFVCINFSYAIDLNLTEQTNNITNANYTSEENETNENNNTSSNVSSNSIESTDDTISSTRVSTVNNLPESNLGLSNILNILLITVGIVLILLGIAILIKLNK